MQEKDIYLKRMKLYCTKKGNVPLSLSLSLSLSPSLPHSLPPSLPPSLPLSLSLSLPPPHPPPPPLSLHFHFFTWRVHCECEDMLINDPVHFNAKLQKHHFLVLAIKWQLDHPRAFLYVRHCPHACLGDVEGKKEHDCAKGIATRFELYIRIRKEQEWVPM